MDDMYFSVSVADVTYGRIVKEYPAYPMRFDVINDDSAPFTTPSQATADTIISHRVGEDRVDLGCGYGPANSKYTPYSTDLGRSNAQEGITDSNYQEAVANTQYDDAATWSGTIPCNGNSVSFDSPDVRVDHTLASQDNPSTGLNQVLLNGGD